ncbi:hypothetical protein [Kamptonema formosum]|nr:hypothetical protein [Oscillatoria sp. PCC 10802]
MSGDAEFSSPLIFCDEGRGRIAGTCLGKGSGAGDLWGDRGSEPVGD